MVYGADVASVDKGAQNEVILTLVARPSNLDEFFDVDTWLGLQCAARNTNANSLALASTPLHLAPFQRLRQ